MSITEISPQTTIVPVINGSRPQSIVEKTECGESSHADCIPPLSNKQMNRIREVREQQGISLRTVARGRNVSIRQVRSEENPRSDLSLSAIYQWQQYLEVPIADLLVESTDPLSRPVLERARMIKLMKTIATIRQRAGDDEVTRLAETLFNQAVELMPELADVQPWQRVGQRRTLDEFGRAAEYQISDELFARLDG